jgi:hypothetical protein
VSDSEDEDTENGSSRKNRKNSKEHRGRENSILSGEGNYSQELHVSLSFRGAIEGG